MLKLKIDPQLMWDIIIGESVVRPPMKVYKRKSPGVGLFLLYGRSNEASKPDNRLYAAKTVQNSQGGNDILFIGFVFRYG